MKKHFIAFMMPFLTLATGFAQEAAQDVPVKQDTKEISYWTDPASGGKRLLNKSKFRDNWFVGLQAGAFYSWGTHTSSSGFFAPGIGFYQCQEVSASVSTNLFCGYGTVPMPDGRCP